MISTGLLGTNEQVPKGYTTGYKPGGYNYGGDKVPFIATGLYVSGAMTGADGEKLTLNDVVITTNRHVAANYDGDIATNLSGESTLGGKAAEGTFHSVQDMKNPYELEPFNIAYPTWTNDDGDTTNATCTYYIYVRGQLHKPKYISKIFVGAYSVEDYSPDKRDEDVDKEVEKQVDLNALVSANGAASDEVIPANIAAERNITWYAGTINYGCRNYDSIRTKRGRYLQPDDKMIKDEYVVPYKPHKISARKSGSGTEDTFTPAAYMSVARTDNEADAIKGIVLFKTDKDMVPELIQLEGVDYWCASPTVPIRMKINKPTDDGWARFETYKYFLYYTRNKGVAPGQPIMELSADDDIFNSGMVTALCANKADTKGDNATTARPYGEANMAQFVHATYRKTNRMYFNKVFTASGDTRREALAGLLEQGCTEFLDMDLNNGVSLTDEDIDEDEDKTGGKNVYFGFRGYTLDEDKIKEIVNKDAQEREKQSQMQEAIYDIICTVGEPYHPEGIVTDKYQIYYSPVSKLDSNDNLVGTNLNDGTDAPEIYMYYTTVWAAEQYNNKVGTDTRKNLSSMPNDIFGSPLTRLCFTTYNRIPYNGTGTGTNANPADNDKKWEYVMYKDSTEPVDFNDGAIKLDTDLHIQNTRVTMFAQRENGKPKPSAEITGGYTSSYTEFSSLNIKMGD